MKRPMPTIERVCAVDSGWMRAMNSPSRAILVEWSSWTFSFLGMACTLRSRRTLNQLNYAPAFASRMLGILVAPVVRALRWHRDLNHGDTSHEASTDGGRRHTGKSRALGHSHFLAVDRDSNVRSPIVGLFSRGGPSHIAWFVVPVNVNAVERPTRARMRTDIRKERGERTMPPRANGNASPTIVAVSWTTWVLAAGDHTCPHVVFA